MTSMQVTVDSNLVKQTMIVTSILTMKYFVCILFQGKARIYAGSRPPEDASLFPKAGAQNFHGDGKFKDDDAKGKKCKEIESRWLRLIQNDIENIPLGLIIAWGSLLCNPNAMIQQLFLWVFCASRLGHSFAYANAMQPARAIFWFGGIVGMLALAANGLVACFR